MTRALNRGWPLLVGGAGIALATVTLPPLPPQPGVLSSVYTTDFTGPANVHLESFPGWTRVGGYTGVTPVSDGSGRMGGANTTLAAGQGIFHTQPGTAVGSTTSFTFSDSAQYVTGMAVFAADGTHHLSGGCATFGGGTNCNMSSWVLTQGGTTKSLGFPGTTTPPDAQGRWTITLSVSADGKTLSGTIVGANTVALGPVDISSGGVAPTLGAGLGPYPSSYGEGGFNSGSTLWQATFSNPATGLSIASAVVSTSGRSAKWALAWDTSKIKPTAIQHRLYDSTGTAQTDWITGTSTINADGSIVYTDSAPRTGTFFARFRPFNDTPIVASAALATVYGGPAAVFGSNAGVPNPFDPAYQILQDPFAEGYWQDFNVGGSPIVDYYSAPSKVDVNDQPLITGLGREMGHGPVSGGYLVLSWTGAPGMQPVPVSTEGNTAYDNITYPTAQSMRFRETFDYSPGSYTFGRIQFNSFDTSNPPKNLKITCEGMAAPGAPPYTDNYISFMSQFPGPIRSMDDLNTNGHGSDGATVTFARLRPVIERIISRANATGRDEWYNITPYMPDAEVVKCLQALDTGAGTSNGVGIRAGIKIWVEWGNEAWNTAAGFTLYATMQNAYRTRTGEARGDSNLDYTQAMKEFTYQHNRIMALVESTIPTWASRCIRVVATGPGTSFTMYNAFKANGGAHYDDHAQAPYFSVPWSSGQSVDPAVLGPLWKKAGTDILNLLLPIAAATYADGKRFVCYEAGPDVASAGLQAKDAWAFRAHPQFYDVIRTFLEGWKNQFGDVMPYFTDLGGAYPSAKPTTPTGLWGLVDYQGSPHSYAFRAMQDAIAGNYNQRPS